MTKRHIRIVCSLPYPVPTGWDELLHRTFAELGWRVVGYGATQSAVHPEEDSLELESESTAIEFATLKKVLTDLSIAAYDYGYSGDINGLPGTAP